MDVDGDREGGGGAFRRVTVLVKRISEFFFVERRDSGFARPVAGRGERLRVR